MFFYTVFHSDRILDSLLDSEEIVIPSYRSGVICIIVIIVLSNL